MTLDHDMRDLNINPNRHFNGEKNYTPGSQVNVYERVKEEGKRWVEGGREKTLRC